MKWKWTLLLIVPCLLSSCETSSLPQGLTVSAGLTPDGRIAATIGSETPPLLAPAATVSDDTNVKDQARRNEKLKHCLPRSLRVQSAGCGVDGDRRRTGGGRGGFSGMTPIN